MRTAVLDLELTRAGKDPSKRRHWWRTVKKVKRQRCEIWEQFPRLRKLQKLRGEKELGMFKTA